MRGIKYNINTDILKSIFGPSSTGESPAEQARTSTQLFVRSQIQLAFASPEATGRLLTASEALSAFGLAALIQVAQEGSFPLVSSSKEPASTIKKRRESLNLPAEKLAKAARITVEQLNNIETPGYVSPIRDLERLAQALALDERVICFHPDSGGDKELGVRLRELADRSGDIGHFTANSVLGLAESAWVIDRQHHLFHEINTNKIHNSGFKFDADHNYSYPSYQKGYALAERTRNILDIDDHEPIHSLRTLIEETLNIPLIQQRLEDKFAGATLANGKTRGIVVNELGRNENVWVRRMTLCHELGHLLWDPDQRLNKLIADDYDIIDGRNFANRDPVEIRANAFAIAFLAPPRAVREIVNQNQEPEDILNQLMLTYGISATAAKWHATNVSGADFTHIPTHSLSKPTDDWLGRENLTIDFHPIIDVPISRRGMFSYLVCRAFKEKLISVDSAAMYLKTTKDKIQENCDKITEIYGNI